MIPIDSITENELDKRFDSLPQKLKDALASERNLTIVEDICQRNRIADEEKKLMVQQIVGLVMLGFIHSYDAGPEINEALSLNNLKFSNLIADELDAKIFSPLKTELEDNYHPVTTEFAAKKAVQDIGAVPKTPVAQPAPQIISQTVAVAPDMGATPPAPAANQTKVVATPPPMPPKPKLPDVGWSRTTPEGPVVKLSQTSAPQPSRVGPSVPPPVPAKQIPIPIKGPVGEFERIAIQGGQRVTPPAQSPTAPKSAAAAEPAPVIIHEDAAFKPQQTTPDFRIQMPAEKFDASKAAQPVKPAVLELGKATPPPANPPPTSTTRVVHYTEYKSSMPASPTVPGMPPAPQGPRQVTEITSAPKLPPITPSPAVAAAPKPPPPPPMLPPK